MWDAYADPVDVDTMQWKEGGFSTRENITLFINIHNAGSYGDGVFLGGVVSVGVKKIEDYTTWPSKEIDKSEYTVYPIAVNKSASLWNRPNPRYVLKIEPKSGRWSSGYYNVVLDVNGTETGWGWFEVVAFQASASFVNENGSEIYTAQGSGPVYFNVSSYSARTSINTSVKEMTLRTWSDTSWFPIEYNYPGEINVTPANVAGSTIITVQRSGGESLTTGYYDGEIVLEDGEGQTATARVWFNIKPFEVMAETSDWEISAAAPINVSLKVIEDYGSYYSYYGSGGILWGNYTIESITENTYTMYGPPTQTNITNYTPTQFNGSTNLIINPPDSKWTSGYHSLAISIKDEEGNTGQAWVSFNAQPFKVMVLSYPGTVRNNQDVVVGLSLPQNLTVSEVYEWSYGYAGSSKVNYNFTPEDLPSGTVNLTILAPDGGWTQGYETWHSLTLVFTDGVDSSEANVWFEVKSFQANIWADPAGKNQNVTLNVDVYEPDWSTPATVNITLVEYYNWNYYGGMVHKRPAPPKTAQTRGGSTQYLDYSAGYTEANFTVSANSTLINGSGTITIIVPTSGWNEGWYDLRVYLKGIPDGDTETAFTNFQVATCDSECSVCSSETECNRSSSSCAWDDLNDEDNTTGVCFSSYGGYVFTCENDCYSCRTQDACNQSSMGCEWSAGYCTIRSLTCDEDCSYCYAENECTNSNASTGCAWDSLTSMCTYTGSTCNDYCYNCYSETSCGSSTVNCTWNPRNYYCKDASETCDIGCYNCYEEGECDNSSANCSWNSMYSSCYEAWQSCDYECSYCYNQEECAGSPVGKCTWSDYYCLRNYTCEEDCYYCYSQTACDASSSGCYWDIWGDWCSINWSTCARDCYYCPNVSECDNSTLSCEWNNASSYCQQGCSDDYCGSCDTQVACNGTSSCWWSNVSSSCKYSYENCSQWCSYCENSAECGASSIGCTWSSGYCMQEYTCDDDCSYCTTEPECNGSSQSCRWRMWNICDYNYGCSYGCTYCDTQLACETGSITCAWDTLEQKCAYTGGTCSDSCDYCYTEIGCNTTNYTTSMYTYNGSEWGYFNVGCIWDGLVSDCVLEGQTCDADCVNCNTNASCTQSLDNCSWDRLNNNCREQGGTCDDYCSNCYNAFNCGVSYANCSWDTPASTCRQEGAPACNTNCSICYYQYSCNLSSANCTWDSGSYSCLEAGVGTCNTNCSVCTGSEQCSNSALNCMWNSTSSACELNTSKLSNGQTCSQASECDSGFCTDCVCCNQACTDSCVSCNLTNHTGTCTTITSAEDPPECNDTSTCDASGNCKKKNGQIYATSGACASGFCKDGICCDTACTDACFSCSTGTCTQVTNADDPPECNGTSTCDAGGSCVLVGAQSCTQASQCASGFCKDGYCCNTACTDPCYSCITGNCTAVTSAADDPECSGNNTCDATGVCKKVNGQSCSAAGECVSGNCADDVCCNEACTTACYSCATGSCTTVTNSTDDPECTSSNTCDTTGACKKANSQSCLVASECASTFCKDAVCCDQSCTYQCQSCATGTCTTVTNGEDDPECSSGYSCNESGLCIQL